MPNKNQDKDYRVIINSDKREISHSGLHESVHTASREPVVVNVVKPLREGKSSNSKQKNGG